MSQTDYSILVSKPGKGHPGIPDSALLIRDNGGNSRSVTNAAEEVVEELVANGHLMPNDQRLFYWDTMGNMDEIVVKDGKFVTIKAGPVQGHF